MCIILVNGLKVCDFKRKLKKLTESKFFFNPPSFKKVYLYCMLPQPSYSSGTHLLF